MLDHQLALVRFVLSGLWLRRWRILIIAWLVSIVGWTVVAALPDSFTAKAQIYIDTESILGPLMRNLAVEPDVQGQVNMMRQTLLARPNLENVAQKAGLIQPDEHSRDVDEVLRRLAKEIEVRPIDSTLFEVRYTTGDPNAAYDVVRAVLDLFVEQNLGLTKRDVDAAQVFIDRQISEYEGKLRAADLALAQFKREHADELGGADRAQRELEETKATKRSLESEQASAVWQRDQLDLQLASTPRRLPRADVVQGPSAAETQVAKLRSDLNRLRLVFTDRHPDVISLTRLVAQAQQEADRDRGARSAAGTLPNPVVAQLEEQIRGLELRISDLQRRIGLATEDVERLARKAAETPAVEADLLHLTRDYDAVSKNYQELVQRRETANLAKQMDLQTRSVEFRIVEPPVVPNQPSGPWRGLLILGSALAGLGAGIGVALLQLLLRREIMRPEQLIAAFEIPLAGIVSELRAPRLGAGQAAELTMACLVAAAFLACSGGLLHRNAVEPLKLDLPGVAGVVSRWVGARFGSGSFG